MKSVRLVLLLLQLLCGIITGGNADVIHINVLDVEEDHEWVYGPEPHEISKRSLPDDMTQAFEEHYSRDVCADRGTFTDRRHSHNAFIVDLASTAELACHYCGERFQDSRYAMIWYKFEKRYDKDTGKLFWQPREVKLDTHDNDNFNKIFTKLDHTLIIRDFQPDDVGTYICEPPSSKVNEKFAFTSEHINSNSAISMTVAWQQVAQTNGISYLHHVDMALPMRSRIVSEDDADFPRPEPPFINDKGNWMVFTKWEPWGECNICGVAGERRREGRCTVKIIEPSKNAHPKYLDEILRFYPEGAPCHSTLFMNFIDIVERQSEIEVGPCRDSLLCQQKDKNGRDIFGVPNFEEMIQINSNKQPPLKKKKPKEETMQLNIGDPLVLECPDTDALSPMSWFNGSNLIPARNLSRLTNGRIQISINVSNALNFTEILLTDDNTTLSCRVGEEDQAVYHLTINPESIKEDIRPYLKYLFISYAVNAVIIVVGAIFQHQRIVEQVTKTKNKQNRK